MMRNLLRVLPGVAVVLALVWPAWTTALAQTGDHLELAGVTTRPLASGSPTDSIPFQVVVNYGLQSVPDGFLLLFLFENGDKSSTRQSSEAVPIHAGSGQVSLSIEYPFHAGVRTLTLMVGLFKDQQRLLTWTSTTPIDLAPWPGRAAFEQAMAARMASDYAAADQYLSAAIGASPEDGTYYYWRGDTRIHLGQYDAAIADFNHSIALMPDDRASHLGRGIGLLWKGDTALAVADLSFAIDHSASADRLTAFAHRARGTAYAALAQRAEAVAEYQAYLQLMPTALDRAEVEGWIAGLS